MCGCRRAAAERLERAADILPLVRAERDEDLRRALIERLVAIAIAPDAATATRRWRWKASRISGSSRPWRRARRTSTVRTAALGRVHDVKALGSVAGTRRMGRRRSTRSRASPIPPSSSTSR